MSDAGHGDKHPRLAIVLQMDALDCQRDDIVFFEVPTFAAIEAFCDRFRSRCAGWSQPDEYAWLFGAELSQPETELAPLLRETQDLISKLGLSAIRFWLDGRVYVLTAARREALARDLRSASTHFPHDTAA
jgi:hypothetical protein